MHACVYKYVCVCVYFCIRAHVRSFVGEPFCVCMCVYAYVGACV